MEWQPIETAPKDGNEALFCYAENGFMFVAFWDDEPTHTSYRWQTADGVCYHRDLPTHWMRLPAPPQ